jgi:tyrosine aminotransferase
VASGCSGALELALTALLNPGDSLLIPQPGFPLYTVIAQSHGAHVVPYKLIPETGECDLRDLAHILRQPNHRYKAMVVNNPGNPTGAVFSMDHICKLIHLCDDYQLPIVADEIYGDMVLPSVGNNSDAVHDPTSSSSPSFWRGFIPVAQVAAAMGLRVPVLTVSGIGKQYGVPGWRVGWVVMQDK